MEDFVGVFGEFETVDLSTIGRIENADVDPGRMRGEKREIGAVGVGGGAEWIGLAFADAHESPLVPLPVRQPAGNLP